MEATSFGVREGKGVVTDKMAGDISLQQGKSAMKTFTVNTFKSDIIMTLRRCMTGP